MTSTTYIISSNAVDIAKRIICNIPELHGVEGSLEMIHALAMVGAALSEAALQLMITTRVEGGRVVASADRQACLAACADAGLRILYPH